MHIIFLKYTSDSPPIKLCIMAININYFRMSSGKNINFFLFLKDLFIHLIERQREGKIFYLLIHFQMISTAKTGPGWSEEPRTPSCSIWVSRSEAFGLSNTAFPGTLVGRCTEHTAAWNWAGFWCKWKSRRKIFLSMSFSLCL